MRITLCGSTRFIESFHHWNRRLTLAGHAVYSVAMPTTGVNEVDSSEGEQKLVLDAVHMAKIANSDAIFVITRPHDNLLVSGYIGESTKREIAFANTMRKPVYWDFRDGLKAHLVNRMVLSLYVVD